MGLAGQNGADHDGGILVLGGIEAALVALAGVLLDPCTSLHELGVVLHHHLGVGDQHLAGLGIHHVANQVAAPDAVGELLNDLAVFADAGDLDAVGHAAVLLTDDDVLRDVHHASGQVTGVCGTQSGIGQALTGATGGNEVFQSGQTFAVVCLDGDLDGLTGGVRDQAAHTGQLTDLLHRTTGAGVRHHEDGVVAVQVLLQSGRNLVGGLFPDLHHLLVTLVVGHKAHLVLVFDVHHHLLGSGDQLVLLGRNGHIRDGNGDGGDSGVMVAGGLDGVQHLGSHGETVLVDGAVHDLAQLLLAAGEGDLVVADVLGITAVHEAQILRNVLVEDDPAGGAGHHAGNAFAVDLQRPAHQNGAVGTDGPVIVGHEGFVLAGVHVNRLEGSGLLALLQSGVGCQELVRVHNALCGQVRVTGILTPDGLGADLVLAHAVHGQVVGAQHHILGRNGDGAAVLRTQQVVGREHQDPGLRLSLGGQRHMNSHLVAVEVGVERGAVQGVQLQSAAVHQHRLEGLNAQTVQGRCTV